MSDLSQPPTFSLDVPVVPTGSPLPGWPTPPGVKATGGWPLGADEPCSIEGLNDKVFGGRLTMFDPVGRQVQVLIPPARTPVTLRFSQFRRLTLMKSVHPPRGKPDSDTAFGAFDTGADDVEYHVRLESGRVLVGRTLGHVENEVGLFLFLPTDVPGCVQRAFVPRDGYRRVDFGPRLGEVLVDQALVTPGQIATVLLEQQRLRQLRIGEILVEQKAITQKQLEEALAVQKRMPMVRLGEVLVSLDFVNQETLGRALATQSRNRSLPLGELLVRDKLIDRQQLETALELKRAAYRRADTSGPALGDVLVHHDTLTPAEVTEALAEQERLRGQRVGDVLLAKNVVKPEQLIAAIEAQSRMPMVRIGEALISLGYITEQQLDEALASQGKERSVPLGELLVRQGRITREDLSTALARKMGYPVVDIDAYPIESDALRKLPAQAARRLEILPLTVLPGRLVCALEDPSRRDRIDEAEFLTQLKLVPVLPAQRDLTTSIALAYSKHGLDDTGGPMSFDFTSGVPEGTDMLLAALESPQDAGRDDDDDAVEQSDSSLVRLINQMIVEAWTQGASDIHIETLPGREKIKVRFRVDGALRPYLELPHTYRQAIVARIKIMCDLDISERRRPQDGKINFARFVPNCPIELRVAMIPTANGLEDCVLRLLTSARPMPIEKLGLSPHNLDGLKNAIERPYGLVLCVGPTGSGKTTTLHSALSYINTPDRKIWTAEDPVEITQHGLRQVQINPKIDWTFAKALRAFLRADPDVIMVGEIRDNETAEVAIESSLTGHLVFSTLHTNSAAETVTRLLDMGMDPFNFADSLLAVLAQRLVRRVCAGCVTATPATEEQVDELLDDYLHVWTEESQRPARGELHRQWLGRYGQNGRLQLFHGAGCAKCGQTGLKGRAGVHELLTVSRELRRLIQKGARAEEIQQLAMREGMRTLRQDGIEKVLAGQTTIEEVRSTSNV